MIVLICNLLLGFLETKTDPKTIYKIKLEAELSYEKFKAENVYGEETFKSLFNAAVKVLNINKKTAEKMFAEYIINIPVEKLGSFFRSSKTFFDLLRKVPKIHLDLPSSMSITTSEKLRLAVNKDNRIVNHYSSPNQLCTFLKALREQVFKHYNVSDYSINKTQWEKDITENCEIILTTNK